MANISVRKLEDDVYDRLARLAQEEGVSMEEEVRQIITRAVAIPAQITTVFKKHFGPENGVDLDLSDHSQPHDQPIEF